MVLAACGNQQKEEHSSKQADQPASGTQDKHEAMQHMQHDESGKLPPNLKVAKDPKYKIGSPVVIKADHMKGMKNAKGKIVGAFDTTAYVVSYQPTTGGEKVKNHKWVIQEEIKNADDQELQPGKAVILEADHMKGMKGAKATIESAEKTTVYMVDYQPTNGGKDVKNHKWVVEDELSPRS